MANRSSAAKSSLKPGSRVPFNSVSMPGNYATDDGDVIQVLPEGLKEGHSPMIRFRSSDPEVTLLSTDPYETWINLNLVAADLNLKLNWGAESEKQSA